MEKLNLLLVLLLLLIALISLNQGSVALNYQQALTDAFQGRWETVDALILFDIRLPRTLLAICSGAALAIAGASLQGLLRNPLVDPGLIGISQGAAVGAALVFYYQFFNFLGAFAVPVAGLAGAGLTLLLLMLLSAKVARVTPLIMIGLALSTGFSALLALLLNFAPNPFALQELVFWMLGSVANRSLQLALLLLLVTGIGMVLLLRQARFLYALSLGEEVAQSMGFNLRHHNRMIIFANALLVGCSVAIVGNIGFVGLIVPHLLRAFLKQRPDKLLLPSAMLGAILVCTADILLRWMPPDRELKLGVLTSVLGAPLFIWLVWKGRHQWL